MGDERHASLMDSIYKSQRHIYDITRRYYLLGRDELIRDLQPGDSETVLEVGCGTGRNLIKAAQAYPNAHFYGFDISEEMLITARAQIEKYNLSNRITLAQGDASNFSVKDLFGLDDVDRVFYSYTLSMIPPWEAAIAEGYKALSTSGSLHIVDFGQQEKLPGFFKSILSWWLKAFHVKPREDLVKSVQVKADANNRELVFTPLFRGYAWALKST